MSDILKQIGGQIRRYRQARGLTLTQFAEQLFKSKATVSKYENGLISIDMETLYQISRILEIPVRHLLVADPAPAENQHPQDAPFTRGYLYSAARGRLTRSVLDHFTDPEDGTITVDFYYDVPSFEQLEKCRGLYEGTMSRQGTVMNYQFVNLGNKMEHAFLCILESLDNNGHNMGLLSSISSTTMFPNAIKVLLSRTRMPEDQDLMNLLLFDRSDVHRMKKDNMLSIIRR